MNKKLLTGALAAMAFLLPSTAAGQTADFNIIPRPQQVNVSNDAPFTLSAKTVISLGTNSQNMKRNANMLASYIEQATGIRPAVGKSKNGTAIVLTIDKTIANAEGYKLDADAKQIRIAGASAAGVFYGIQTLRKSLPLVNGKASKVSIPAVHIADAPRFAYRGTHLDVSRHFVTADSVRQFIDMLALHNINRFHWHLTDDQGWRIEIKKYPLLTQIGSKRAQTVIGHNSGKYDGKPYSGFYTQKQIRDIVKYAADRYITIVPEIDLPGHMQAALAAYPDMGCTGGPYEVWQKWGVSDNVLCAGNDKTLTFIDNVLKEITKLFPSKYIHVGGDECPKTQWQKCPKCQARIKALNLEAKDGHSAEERLQSYIITHASNYLKSLGRNTIGWDEILEGGLAEGATVMSWRGESGGIAAAKQHHDVVMTPNSYLYFDYYQSLDKANEPLAIGGYLPLETVYSYEPMPKELTADEARHIIGVQANIWTEYMPTFKQMQYMALPRLAALSEVQWSQPALKDYTSFTNRLTEFTHLYDRLGYNYAKHLYNVAIHVDSDNKWREILIHMTTAGKAEIRYTLDGTEPTVNSTLYTGAIVLQKSAKIRAAAFRDGKRSSVTSQDISFNKATACPVELLQPTHKNYTYKGGATLTDGLLGDKGFGTGRWLGFSGNDLEAVIDLKQNTDVSSVSLNTCVDKGSWIFDARNIEVSVSADGKSFTKVASKSLPALEEQTPDNIYTYELTFPQTTTRYVKVTATSEHNIPEWHGGKGKPAFLFVDEISVK
ncbi:glycoside hydrolase family 20 protein [uncultured Prevotella sp.]|jgi:hexosaminidase|uniref:glycoside hydrolase family 20 protein n=1 Tax=uncultured Prevotella sp. TaxID=159272 RepID=UPI00266D1955|nr:glycoside hydrolase family 20 protein [uncultured Prevotella sp.]